MKIRNATDWDTRQIRKLVSAVMRHEGLVGVRDSWVDLNGVTRARRRWSQITVWVQYRKRGPLGRAPYNGNRFDLYVPKPTEPWDSALWAHVTGHELAHLQGVRHRNMASCHRWHDGWRAEWEWADAYPVTAKIPVNVEVPRVEVIQTKLDHARSMATAWERKAATAGRRAAKWKRRAKRLDTSLRKAATGAPPGLTGIPKVV